MGWGGCKSNIRYAAGCAHPPCALAAADALQAVCRVESDRIGKGMPFQDPRIDLPLIAAQAESSRARRRDRSKRRRIAAPPSGQLQFAGGLFIAEAPIGARFVAISAAQRASKKKTSAVAPSILRRAPSSGAGGDRREKEQIPPARR